MWEVKLCSEHLLHVKITNSFIELFVPLTFKLCYTLCIAVLF